MACQTRSETASQSLVVQGRNSGELNICDLIDDVLISIFNFLDVRTLLVFCETIETCKKLAHLRRIIIANVLPSKMLYIDTECDTDSIVRLFEKYETRATKISFRALNTELINEYLELLPKLCQPVGHPGMLTEFHIHLLIHPILLCHNSLLQRQSLPLLRNVIHLTFDGLGGEIFLQAKSLSKIRTLKLNLVNLCGENFHLNVNSFPNLRCLHLCCHHCFCVENHSNKITHFILTKLQLELLYYCGRDTELLLLKATENLENIKSLGVISLYCNISNDGDKMKQIGEIFKNLATKNAIKTLKCKFRINNEPGSNCMFDPSVYSKIVLEIPSLESLHIYNFLLGPEINKLFEFLVMTMKNIKTLKVISYSKITHKSLIGIIKTNQRLEAIIIDSVFNMSAGLYKTLLKERQKINDLCKTPKSLNICMTQQLDAVIEVNLRKVYNPQIISLSSIKFSHRNRNFI